MRVSLRWLADYIDLPTGDPEEIKAAFASLGHEVESVEHLEPQWRDVYVAQVESIRPHPDADKIRLCTVTTGRDPIEVVCGAWNFEAGAKVAFAPPGARLAGGMEIGRRVIRGIESMGMICSERELGLGDDHTGILLLAADAPLGVDFTELVALPDVIYELSITNNRPDVMSMVGAARELSAYFQVPFRLPPIEPPTVEGTAAIKVEIADPAGCSRFAARQVEDVTPGPSPLWMRQRLRAAGVRPISNIVDVSNYVMMELGQPIHTFDLDRLRGDRIVVRRAWPAEKLRTLDGVDRDLTPDDLVVADGEGVSALAGTMGGEDSEVGSGTSRVLIEAASWDPPTVMFMSRRHGLRSEASARFERGVDPNLPPIAAARAARLMVEVAGGEVVEGWVDEVAVVTEPWQVELSLAEVARIIGPGIDPAASAGLLRRLHLVVSGEDPLQVTVPTYRRDLIRSIDLVEEVARLWGYDRLPETVPTGSSGGWSTQQKRGHRLRRVLNGVGLSEALNLSFLGLNDLEAMGYPLDHEARATIRVKNPLNEELASLRTSLIPGLLRSLAYNLSHGIGDGALFEIGRVFFGRWGTEDRRLPDQPQRLGFVVSGEFGPSNLEGRGRIADVYTATALWRLIADELQLGYFRLLPVVVPGFHPGRTAQVLLDDRPIGQVGELRPSTVAAYDLTGRVAAGELDLAHLLDPVEPWLLVEPSLYPPVEFDLAFDLPIAVPAAEVLATTARAGGEIVEDVSVFDEYRGTNLPEGRKSLALHYTLRSAQRTLTNEEAAEVRRAMIEAASGLGANLRGAS